MAQMTADRRIIIIIVYNNTYNVRLYVFEEEIIYKIERQFFTRFSNDVWTIITTLVVHISSVFHYRIVFVAVLCEGEMIAVFIQWSRIVCMDHIIFNEVVIMLGYIKPG